MNLRIRGEPERKGELVPRSTLSALAKSAPSPVFKDDSSGRLELAQWMTSASNPLTSRVYANRVWLHLFGRPLVSSPDNFGRMTAAPTHPELLDLLASRLVEGGWSTKRLIRELVLSSAYQMSTDWNAKAAARDPDNTFWWRMNRRRRDAVSTAYGQAFGRAPTEAEAKAAQDFLLRAGGQSKDALSLLCQALMSSNEWQYLE